MITDYYEVTVDPINDPISLSEAKDWLRVRSTADDALISALITTATIAGEKFTNRLFLSRTIAGYFSGLEASQFESVPFVTLRRAPLGAVSSVEIYSGGAYVAFTDYSVKNTQTFPRILFNNGIYDAAPDSDATYPLRITFTAGYGTSADVPEPIKTALKAHLAFLYENRGDVVADGALGMPLETKAIYQGKYRILNTFG